MKCIECNHELSQEEIDVNMCWECGHIIDESLVDEEYLEAVNNQNIQVKEQLKKEKELKQISENYKEVSKNFLMTTGYNFEGYKIVAYKGIVHSESSIGTGFLSELSLQVNDLLGTGSQIFESKLSEAKAYAEKQLMNQAIYVGGNAIIGIDYDIMSLNNNMIIVSANATSVFIEKIKD